MEYADISELNDKAQYVRVTWNKMINYANTFSTEFLAVEEEFKAGKYGPEWTFARWLGVKCGMSHSTTYRMIQELHRIASDDQREKIRRVVEEKQRIKLLKDADSRATQIAWSLWLADEKKRINDTQVAWDEYHTEQKKLAIAEKNATQQAKKDEKKRFTTNAKQRRYRSNAKAKKTNENKALRRVTLFSEDSEKRVSHMKQRKVVDNAFYVLLVALRKLSKNDRVECVENIITHLEDLISSNSDEIHINGHNPEPQPETTSI